MLSPKRLLNYLVRVRSFRVKVREGLSRYHDGKPPLSPSSMPSNTLQDYYRVGLVTWEGGSKSGANSFLTGANLGAPKKSVAPFMGIGTPKLCVGAVSYAWS